jgi:putative hydrolase of the HAD superfamily
VSRFAFADDVRAVLFDLGNTLMWIDHALLAEALASAGVAADEAAVRVAEMRTRPRIDVFLASAARRESADIHDRFARLFLDELREGLSAHDGARAACLSAWPSLWRSVPDDARPTLDRLRERGYRLAVVSNTGDGGARSRLAAASLLDALEFVVDSHELGIEKPDPRIFAHAAETLGLPASACLYLGDLYSVDVVGARAAGMHAALIDPIGAWSDHAGARAAPRVASLTEFAARL